MFIHYFFVILRINRYSNAESSIRRMSRHFNLPKIHLGENGKVIRIVGVGGSGSYVADIECQQPTFGIQCGLLIVM